MIIQQVFLRAVEVQSHWGPLGGSAELTSVPAEERGSGPFILHSHPSLAEGVLRQVGLPSAQAQVKSPSVQTGMGNAWEMPTGH